MSSPTSQRCCHGRTRPACGGLVYVPTEGLVEGWTTSGTTTYLSPSLTGTETSQVQSQNALPAERQDKLWILSETMKHSRRCRFNPDRLLSVDNGDGTCVAMTSGTVGGFWDDKPCFEKFNFVCEKPRPDISPPTTAVTPTPLPGCSNGWSGKPHFRNCYRVQSYSPLTLNTEVTYPVTPTLTH